MIELLALLGATLVFFGLIFVFSHPYTKARSHVRSSFLSGGGNAGVVLVILGLIAVVLAYYLPQ